MSNVNVKKGNLFASKRQTLVNTVNCVGVMGAGIALGFKLRHPAMFRRYEEMCRQGHMEVGKLWLYKPDEGSGDKRWVLNFPTKKHWRFPSREEYLASGLAKFVATYRQRGIESIAFPLLGAQHGGLPEAMVIDLMRDELKKCDIPVDIYQYDPEAKDDLIDPLKSGLEGLEVHELAVDTGIDARRLGILRRALQRPDVLSLTKLATVKGIGEKTLAKAVMWVTRRDPAPSSQEQEPEDAGGHVPEPDPDVSEQPMLGAEFSDC